MPNQQKVEIVGKLKDMLTDVPTLILTDPTGLNVKSISTLRARLREVDSEFHVVKNTLVKLASEGMPVQEVVADLEGPTAIALTRSDPVAMAKAITGFAREFKLLSIKGGLIEGRAATPQQVQGLATIPPRPQLVAMVVGGLQSPISGLVGTLQSTIASLAMTVQAIAEQKAA